MGERQRIWHNHCWGPIATTSIGSRLLKLTVIRTSTPHASYEQRKQEPYQDNGDIWRERKIDGMKVKDKPRNPKRIEIAIL